MKITSRVCVNRERSYQLALCDTKARLSRNERLLFFYLVREVAVCVCWSQQGCSSTDRPRIEFDSPIVTKPNKK